MFYIDNGATRHEFEETDFNYFTLVGLTITVRDIHNVDTAITFTNNYDMQQQLDRIIRELHKRLATVGAIAAGVGIIFWINCANIFSHSVLGANIAVVFFGGQSITMTCADATEATHHWIPLSRCYISTHLPQYMVGKTILYVNSDQAANGIDRFNTWQEAINAAVSGNIIVIEPSNYLENYIVPKMGVDTIIQQGAFFYYTDPTKPTSIKDTAGRADCNIFGQGVFYNNRTNTDTGAWLMCDPVSGSEIYFEFDQVVSSAIRTDANSCANFHIDNGKLWLKGSLNYGTQNRPFDSDSIPGDLIDAVIDNDILVNATDIGDTLYFCLSGIKTHYYFRNGYYELNGKGQPSAMFYLSDSAAPNINFINAKCRNNNINVGALIVLVEGGYSEGVIKTRAWNSYFQTHDEIPLFFLDGQGITVYNDCYSVTPQMLEEPVLGPGEMHVRTFDLLRPELHDLEGSPVADKSNIAAFYQRSYNGVFEGVTFDNVTDEANYIRDFVVANHDQYATLQDKNGPVYHIDLSKNIIYDRQGVFLNLFLDNSARTALRIECIDEQDAIYLYAYFDSLYTAYRVEEYIADRPQRHVAPSGQAYTDIQPAIDESSSGDVVIVHEGTYSSFTNKNGVDLYFLNNECIVTSTSTAVGFPTGVVSKIFGKGKFINTNNDPFASVVGGSAAFGSFFQYDTLEHLQGRVVVTEGGHLGMHGKNIITESLSYTAFDSDGQGNFDCDCLNIIAKVGLIFNQDFGSNLSKIFRNAYIEGDSNGEAVIAPAQSIDPIKYSFINCRIKQKGTGGGVGRCIRYNATPPGGSTYHFWNTFFDSVGGTNNFSSAGENLNLYFYNKCYSDKTYGTFIVINNENAPNGFTVDATLNITA